METKTEKDYGALPWQQLESSQKVTGKGFGVDHLETDSL